MICSFCKHEFDRPNKEYKDICIDGYSKEHLFEHLDQIFEMCPNCGIILGDLAIYPDDEVAQRIIREAFASSEEYQKVLQDKSIDRLEKKLLLGQIARYTTPLGNSKHNNDMDWTLFIFYHSKELHDKARIYADNVIKRNLDWLQFQQKHHKTQSYTTEVLSSANGNLIRLIEVYRLLGDFENAKKYIDILKPYKFRRYQRYEKGIFDVQKRLCKRKDSKRALDPQKKDILIGFECNHS